MSDDMVTVYGILYAWGDASPIYAPEVELCASDIRLLATHKITGELISAGVPVGDAHHIAADAIRDLPIGEPICIGHPVTAKLIVTVMLYELTLPAQFARPEFRS